MHGYFAILSESGIYSLEKRWIQSNARKENFLKFENALAFLNQKKK